MDHLTVHSKDNIVFALARGMEVKAERNYGASPSGGTLILWWIVAIFTLQLVNLFINLLTGGDIGVMAILACSRIAIVFVEKLPCIMS